MPEMIHAPSPLMDSAMVVGDVERLNVCSEDAWVLGNEGARSFARFLTLRRVAILMGHIACQELAAVHW